MRTIRLGDIGKTLSGGTPSSKHPEYFEGDIPWIGTTALNGGVLTSNDAVKRITREAVEHSATKLIPAGSLMVGIRVGVGKVAVNAVPMCTSQDIVSIVDIDEECWNQEFISLVIQAKASELASQAQGATIKGITSKDLKACEIPDIPRLKQDSIVERLNAIKLLCEKESQIEVKLDELVKSRFVEMFETSCHWNRRMLRECCASPDDIRCGPFGSQLHKEDYRHSGVPIWGIPEVGSSFASLPEKFVSEGTAKRLTSYSIVKGDVALSRKGNVGQAAWFDGSMPAGIIHSDVLRIRPNPNILDSRFLVEQLHDSYQVRKQIISASTGAIMAGTNVGKLKKIVVDVPPLPLQQEFSSFVSHVDALKAKNQQAIDDLQTLYASLAREYFGN